MSSKGMRWMLAAMLLGTGCVALGQNVPVQNAPGQNAPSQKAQEPLSSLPAAPAQKPLVLPKTSGPIPLYASRPGDVPPPAPLPEEEDTFCTTPTDTFYRTEKPLTAETKKAVADYGWAIKRQIYQNWKAPREVNDPWLKGAQVRVKFEILADGSLNDPVIMMTSGRASYDRRALESIKTSAPFPPPPVGLRPYRMCFRFGYNMDREVRDPMPVDVFVKKPGQP